MRTAGSAADGGLTRREAIARGSLALAATSRHVLERDGGRRPLIAWYTDGDLSGVASGRERPREFVAAWRRIVSVFRSAGATNVRWVWCPLALERAWSPADDWRRYYPGDRWVDWLGMDGYNWATTRSWSKWQTFRDIFGPVYSQYARRKPTMICEVASAQSGGCSSPSWSGRPQVILPLAGAAH